jgi:hypothetical protein
MNIEFDSKNTIYHQCMESNVDPACLNAIKKLQELVRYIRISNTILYTRMIVGWF